MSLSDGIARVVGTGIYSGYFPFFPGTIGSVVGLALYAILASKIGWLRKPGAPWLVLLACFLPLGAWAAGRCEKIYGADDRHIVIDEIWGMLIALQGVPLRPPLLLAAFLLFRLFDIFKPYPGRKVERIGRGIGVMLDDGLAGAYSLVVLMVIRSLGGS